MLALVLYYCCFKILNIFGTKDLRFHFAQGWANYVASPGLSLTIFILIFNNSQHPPRERSQRPVLCRWANKYLSQNMVL